MINIEGIRVLNTYVTKSPDFGAIMLALIFGLGILALGVVFLIYKELGEGIFCTVFGAFMVLVAIFLLTSRVPITHYDVLIDNSASLTEVYDKYKIDGKDGDIYHLILREEPEEDKIND